jgi:hypothetical protein
MLLDSDVSMALELYMVGVIVEDMGRAVEFYRRLGVDVPEGAESLGVRRRRRIATELCDSSPCDAPGRSQAQMTPMRVDTSPPISFTSVVVRPFA